MSSSAWRYTDLFIYLFILIHERLKNTLHLSRKVFVSYWTRIGIFSALESLSTVSCAWEKSHPSFGSSQWPWWLCSAVRRELLCVRLGAQSHVWARRFCRICLCRHRHHRLLAGVGVLGLALYC